jgi:hypothetical protein
MMGCFRPGSRCRADYDRDASQNRGQRAHQGFQAPRHCPPSCCVTGTLGDIGIDMQSMKAQGRRKDSFHDSLPIAPGQGPEPGDSPQSPVRPECPCANRPVSACGSGRYPPSGYPRLWTLGSLRQRDCKVLGRINALVYPSLPVVCRQRLALSPSNRLNFTLNCAHIA